ncbi:hypothetical protein K432DRAFT_405301 [Lepidopterella palustris CBS 459.81]|uniref:Uncharacterized protein n=1 Tax=Lepidopterella palustris CBS 459.81 TaxID=1314670 RepID=A0A8E2E9A0_9PEZI|nr:hypothetical protein K432DRAFT_405301 [Lepidopterella palustris CBS 459.81]
MGANLSPVSPEPPPTFFATMFNHSEGDPWLVNSNPRLFPTDYASFKPSDSSPLNVNCVNGSCSPENAANITSWNFRNFRGFSEDFYRCTSWPGVTFAASSSTDLQPRGICKKVSLDDACPVRHDFMQMMTLWICVAVFGLVLLACILTWCCRLRDRRRYDRAWQPSVNGPDVPRNLSQSALGT